MIKYVLVNNVGKYARLYKNKSHSDLMEITDVNDLDKASLFTCAELRKSPIKEIVGKSYMLVEAYEERKVYLNCASYTGE